MTDTEILDTLRSWVGRPYAKMRCWDLVVEAYALRGIEIPKAYAESLERRMWRTVTDPQPWDVVPIIEHELPIVTHVGLVLDGGMYLQAVQQSGVVLRDLSRPPAFGRFAERDGAPAFLRLRQNFA